MLHEIRSWVKWLRRSEAWIRVGRWQPKVTPIPGPGPCILILWLGKISNSDILDWLSRWEKDKLLFFKIIFATIWILCIQLKRTWFLLLLLCFEVVISPAAGNSYVRLVKFTYWKCGNDCPGTDGATLKNIGNIGLYIIKTKRSKDEIACNIYKGKTNVSHVSII